MLENDAIPDKSIVVNLARAFVTAPVVMELRQLFG
jgi:hypothetical protein